MVYGTVTCRQLFLIDIRSTKNPPNFLRGNLRFHAINVTARAII